MKTKLLALLTLLLFSQASFSQGFQGKGDGIFSLGASFGRGQYGYYGGHNQLNILPPLSLFLEIGVHKWFSVGLYAGWEHRRFEGVLNLDRINHAEWEWTELWLSGGLRANWYISSFLNDKANANLPEQLHFYLGVLGGIDHYGKNRLNEWTGGEYPQRITQPDVAASVGVRYMFTPAFGVFLEAYAGYFRDGTFGVSLKF